LAASNIDSDIGHFKHFWGCFLRNIGEMFLAFSIGGRARSSVWTREVESRDPDPLLVYKVKELN